MNRTILMNFSGVYDLESFSRNPAFVHLDCTHLSGTDCYCDQKAAKRIRTLIAPYPAEGIHFIDSGDYHYLTEFWTDKLERPFSLILFDHHTDMQTPLFDRLLSCGGWVKSMLDHNPYLLKVYLIGPSEEQASTIPAPYRERVIAYTDTRLHLHLPSSHSLSLKEPVYISIDKDVLDKQSSLTNWDQGSLTLKELKALLTQILKHDQVIGIDICGECASCLHQLTTDPAIRLDNEANTELLQLMRQLKPFASQAATTCSTRNPGVKPVQKTLTAVTPKGMREVKLKK